MISIHSNRHRWIFILDTKNLRLKQKPREEFQSNVLKSTSDIIVSFIKVGQVRQFRNWRTVINIFYIYMYVFDAILHKHNFLLRIFFLPLEVHIIFYYSVSVILSFISHSINLVFVSTNEIFIIFILYYFTQNIRKFVSNFDSVNFTHRYCY